MRTCLLIAFAVLGLIASNGVAGAAPSVTGIHAVPSGHAVTVDYGWHHHRWHHRHWYHGHWRYWD